MNLFIKKKYAIRHKILQALFGEYQDALPNDNMEDVVCSSSRLVTLSKLSETDVFSQTDYLISVNEIKSVDYDYSDFYYITNKGRIAYHDKKYLEEGRTNLFNSVKEWVTLCSIIIAICISVFTFISNYFETKKNSTAIEEIKNQLKELNKAQSKK